MRVLSLFDGMSGAQLALRRAGFRTSFYVASEVNPHAIKVTQKNFPLTCQWGDVNSLSPAMVKEAGPWDLVIFGSPCTDLSRAKQGRQSLSGDASGLFYQAVRLLEAAKPRFFFMENVASMTDESRDKITKILGVQPARINSSYFVPQLRDRLYWFNWTAFEPDRQCPRTLAAALLSPVDVLHLAISDTAKRWMDTVTSDGRRTRWDFGQHSDTKDGFSKCVVANWKKGVPFTVLIDRRMDLPFYRHFHPIEAERLQGFPDNYTHGVAKTHRFEMIGNSFTVPVISYLLGPLHELL